MSEQAVFDALKYRVEVDAFGTREYYNNAGYLHRTDGPAIVCTNGHKEWWQNGRLHRTGGPAIEAVDGYKAWYINGGRLTEAEFSQRVQALWMNNQSLKH